MQMRKIRNCGAAVDILIDAGSDTPTSVFGKLDKSAPKGVAVLDRGYLAHVVGPGV